jgi:hypothetical protein
MWARRFDPWPATTLAVIRNCGIKASRNDFPKCVSGASPICRCPDKSACKNHCAKYQGLDTAAEKEIQVSSSLTGFPTPAHFNLVPATFTVSNLITGSA